MDSSFLSNFFMIGLIGILGAMSPGPDFVIVTKNSLSYSRKAGLYTSFGITLAVMVHITYCLLGIGFFIAESPFLFNCIKYSGAAYLIYIGLKSLLTKTTTPENSFKDWKPENKDLPPFQALKTGFFTNVLNPKATLFFLSVFSQVIDPKTPFITQTLFGLELVLACLAWFCLLAFLLSHPYLRSRILGVQHYFERAMGLLLVFFGLKIAFI